MTIDRPKPVSNAYIKSDNAAPNPVTKPDHRPIFNVRCIHNIPMDGQDIYAMNAEQLAHSNYSI